MSIEAISQRHAGRSCAVEQVSSAASRRLVVWPHAVVWVLCGDLTRVDFVTLISVQCNSLSVYFEEKLRVSVCFPWFLSISSVVAAQLVFWLKGTVRCSPALSCCNCLCVFRRIAECKGTLDLKLLGKLL